MGNNAPQSKDANVEAEELRFEYDQLRKEILNNSTVSLQMLGGILVITGVVLNAALDKGVSDPKEKAALIGFIWLLASLGMLFTRDRARSTGMIAAYLRLVIEPRTQAIRWESNLFDLRERHPGSGWGSWSFLQLSAYNILSIAAYIFCAAYSLAGIEKLPGYWAVAICTLLVVGLSITVWWLVEAVQWNRRTEPNLKKNFEAQWTEVLKAPSTGTNATHADTTAVDNKPTG
jgi:hypothetical protein